MVVLTAVTFQLRPERLPHARTFLHTCTKTHHGRGEAPHLHVIYPDPRHLLIGRLLLYCTIAYISCGQEANLYFRRKSQFIFLPLSKSKFTHFTNQRSSICLANYITYELDTFTDRNMCQQKNVCT